MSNDAWTRNYAQISVKSVAVLMRGARQSVMSCREAEIEDEPQGVLHSCAIGPSHGGTAFRVSTRRRSDKFKAVRLC
jgi:hypothetical protein